MRHFLYRNSSAWEMLILNDSGLLYLDLGAGYPIYTYGNIWLFKYQFPLAISAG